MVKSQVIYKDYSKDAERTALVSGENLAHMFGKIARWYTDISWVGHTHTEANITDFGTYAGSSTKGGAATSANKLNIGASDIGSETKPVYFNATTGKPVACAYSLNASVPANAVFTDINVKQSPSTANESREVLFAGNTGNTETTGTVGKSNKLYFNPNTGALTATSFSGSVDASNLTGSIDAGRLPTTSVTAGSYGPAAGGTLSHGGTFDVGYVTVDKYGRLTAASTKTFTLPAQYVHPTYTSKTSGLYKITVDGTGHVSGTAAVTASDLPAHTHSDYLPLAGGTMTGDLAFTAVTSTSYPAASNQISFGGSTDGGQIFFEVQASDAGALVIQTTDDPNAKIVFRNKVTSGGTRANEVTITDGVISGNGSGLTSLNASNISSGTIAAARLPDSYLPLKGGTMTGAITFQAADAIKYNAANATYTMISFITGDGNGHGVSIGGGGLTVLGSGESASALISALSLAASNETTYIASDNNIEFYSYCQTIGNRLGLVFDTSGRLRPDTNNTRTLGGTDYYWNKAYISQILGRGTAGMWISARDNAIVRQSSMSTTSAYFPVISAKTKLGEWSIGTLGPDAENFYISYTTDANYSAGSNNSNNYYISKDGWFSGTAAKADVWTTARTITIGSTGKSVNGSGNVSWTLSEIGAAAASHSHNYIGAISDGSYWGMGSPSLDGSAWIRTTSNGLIPYQSGGRTSSHSSLGTSGWYFSYAYVNSIYADSIGFNGTKATTQMIKFLDNTTDGTGNGILIGGGGVVCVGAGESASALNSASAFSPGTEQLYLAADGNINLMTNCDTVANRIVTTIDTAGRILAKNQIITSNADGFRICKSGIGSFMRNDGDYTYFLLTDKKTDGSESTAGWNSLRPIYWNNTTGWCTIYGAITRADYPTGFSGRSTSQTWGKQTGTFMTSWYGPNSSSIAFRYDCPNSGQASVIIDGRFYQDEGQYMCLDERNFVNYAARACYVDSFLSANRFAFAKAAGITVQYSRDGGSTLNTYSLTDAQKIAIFTNDVSGVTIGNVSSDYATSQYRTYITLDANTAGLYSQISEFTMRVSTNGSSGTKVYIEGMTVGSSSWSVIKGWTYITGWSGTNHIPINTITFGTGSGHIQKIRFTFGCDGGATSGNYHGMQILHIYGFGGEGWGVQSSLGLTGHMYTWDTSKNVTFPAQITCDVGTINSIATRSAKTASAVTHSGWTDNAHDDAIAPTMSFIAFWNGAYNSSGNSNLAYCNKGAFGTIITKGSGDYIPISGSSNITGFLRVAMGNTAGPKISVHNGTYEVGLHIGTGGVNHGIYDFTSNINTWMCYHNGTEFLFNGKANTATTASKLGTNAGSNISPVYFSGGVPVACKQVASGAFFSTVPFVRSDGVMDIGRYIDFHVTNDATSIGYRLNQWSAGCIELNSYNANNIVNMYAPSGYNQLRFQSGESNKTYTAAGIIVNPLTTSGSVMRIQCGGNMIIGGGESPSTIYSNDYLSCATSESEGLFLTADSSIHLITNLDSYANRKIVTVSNGQIILANNGYIAQDQNSGSNYTTAIRWRKGGSDPGNYGPEIGQHNTGDTDGSVCILPYHTTSNPWDAGVGLFISKTRLLYNGTAISLNGHTHTYLIDPGNASNKIEIAWSGESVPTTATSYPAVYTTHNKSSNVAYRIKEMTWGNFGTMLGLKSAAFTESSAYAAASHNHTDKLGAKSDGTYYGMASPTSADSVWIRTTSLGIIPYQGGALGSGHNSLGTSSWYFGNIYVDNHYGKYLSLGSSSVRGLIEIRGSTSASVSYGSDNPRIRFMNSAADQNIDIVFNDYDSVRAPASLSVHGNQGGEYLLAPNVAAWDYTNNKYMAVLSAWSLGTTSAVGQGRVIAGNGTKKGTAGNARGLIEIYSEQDGAAFIIAPPSLTTDVTVTLPSTNGTMTEVVYKTVKTASSVTHSGWTSVEADSKIVPNMSFIAYWNGAYDSSNHSNLSYCARGALGSIVTHAEGDYLLKTGGTLTGNLKITETKNLILRTTGDDRYIAGIGYDTSGNECIALWAKNTVTRLRWYAGTDMSNMAVGSMMGITPDFEISKASGTAKGYIARDSIVTYKILWSGSTSCTARSSTDITLTTAISANKYRFIKIVWTVSGGTGVSEIRADTLNIINNVSSASGATTANIIQFTISSDGKKLTVGPGTTAITVLQIAGVCVI